MATDDTPTKRPPLYVRAGLTGLGEHLISPFLRGSTTIGTAIWCWCADRPEDDPGRPWWRCGLSAFVLLVAIGSPYTTYATIAAGTTWTAAALAVGYREVPHPATPAPVPDVDQADAERAFVQLLHDAVGDRNGVHLSTIAEILHQHGFLTDWGVPDLRERCAALGVPVRASLKVEGKVRVGVHRDDLPALPQEPRPAPTTEGSAAGQTADYPADYPATTGDLPAPEQPATRHLTRLLGALTERTH